MLTSIQSPSKISLEEFLLLPETKPASEYVGGEIYQKAMPLGKHSTLQTKFSSTINQVGKTQKLAYAFPELRCTFAGCAVVPDLAVFEWSRIPVGANGEIQDIFNIAPDWIIEILSPTESCTRAGHEETPAPRAVLGAGRSASIARETPCRAETCLGTVPLPRQRSGDRA